MEKKILAIFVAMTMAFTAVSTTVADSTEDDNIITEKLYSNDIPYDIHSNTIPAEPYISEVNPVQNGGWIEISNPFEETVSTKGLFLTNDLDDFFKWQMPSLIIRAGEAIGINDVEYGLKRTQSNFYLGVGDNLRLTDGTGKVLAFLEVA